MDKHHSVLQYGTASWGKELDCCCITDTRVKNWAEKAMRTTSKANHLEIIHHYIFCCGWWEKKCTSRDSLFNSNSFTRKPIHRPDYTATSVGGGSW